MSEGRRSAVRDRKPLWQRSTSTSLALALSGLIYWLTARTGFSAVVNPDSNPTLSLSVYMFFAPALLWIGATLLLVRLRGRAPRLARATGRSRQPRSQLRFLLASAGRRGAAINRGLVVSACCSPSASASAIFSATYDQQAQVDAQLTLGADVIVTAPPGTRRRRRTCRRRSHPCRASRRPPRSTTPTPTSAPTSRTPSASTRATFPKATTLRDSYFLGGTASQMMSRLQQTRDGILVSQETITDYSLKPGDLLKLRVLDQRTGRFRVARFHVVGIVQEFPSAPRDSFMVTNLELPAST